MEDFDLDARLWVKLRLAPMCPWVGVVSFAFVEPPDIQARLCSQLTAPASLLCLDRVCLMSVFMLLACATASAK